MLRCAPQQQKNPNENHKNMQRSLLYGDYCPTKRYEAAVNDSGYS
jgi:hypothetical protein